MIGDPCGHGWRLLATCHTQTLVRRAAVVDRTDHVYAMLQRQRAPRQGPPAPRQRGQAFAACRVEPLEVRGVDHPIPLRTAPERLDTRGRAIHDAALDVDNAALGVALADLRHARCYATGATGGASGPPSAPGRETSRASPG